MGRGRGCSLRGNQVPDLCLTSLPLFCGARSLKTSLTVKVTNGKEGVLISWFPWSFTSPVALKDRNTDSGSGGSPPSAAGPGSRSPSSCLQWDCLWQLLSHLRGRISCRWKEHPLPFLHGGQGERGGAEGDGWSGISSFVPLGFGVARQDLLPIVWGEKV